MLSPHVEVWFKTHWNCLPHKNRLFLFNCGPLHNQITEETLHIAIWWNVWTKSWEWRLSALPLMPSTTALILSPSQKPFKQYAQWWPQSSSYWRNPVSWQASTLRTNSLKCYFDVSVWQCFLFGAISPWRRIWILLLLHCLPSAVLSSRLQLPWDVPDTCQRIRVDTLTDGRLR